MNDERDTIDWLAKLQGALAERAVDQGCAALKAKWDHLSRFDVRKEAAQRWLAGEDIWIS